MCYIYYGYFVFICMVLFVIFVSFRLFFYRVIFMVVTLVLFSLHAATLKTLPSLFSYPRQIVEHVTDLCSHVSSNESIRSIK